MPAKHLILVELLQILTAAGVVLLVGARVRRRHARLRRLVGALCPGPGGFFAFLSLKGTPPLPHSARAESRRMREGGLSDDRFCYECRAREDPDVSRLVGCGGQLQNFCVLLWAAPKLSSARGGPLQYFPALAADRSNIKIFRRLRCAGPKMSGARGGPLQDSAAPAAGRSKTLRRLRMAAPTFSGACGGQVRGSKPHLRTLFPSCHSGCSPFHHGEGDVSG